MNRLVRSIVMLLLAGVLLGGLGRWATRHSCRRARCFRARPSTGWGKGEMKVDVHGPVFLERGVAALAVSVTLVALILMAAAVGFVTPQALANAPGEETSNVSGVNDDGTGASQDLVNLALGARYWLSHPPAAQYSDSGSRELTDGKRATGNYTDPRWQGHLREGYRVVTIDLGAPRRVHEVRVGFLQDEGAGITFPAQVLLLLSPNGRDWQQVGAKTAADLGAPAGFVGSKEMVFGSLGGIARYVRLVFSVSVWEFADEVEVWGEASAVEIDSPSDLLDMEDPYLGVKNRDKLPIDWGAEPINRYAAPGTPEVGGARHIMLIYTQKEWSLADALPYVGYAPPRKPGDSWLVQWQDWFFDTFLFLALVTPDNPRHAFDAPSRGTPANWDDWMWFIDYLIDESNQLAAFDSAVGTLKAKLGDEDYRAKVIIMIPYPMPEQKDFGDPLGQGVSLSFSPVGQGQEKALQSQITAVKVYVEELLARWQSRGFENLELIGLYWLAETASENDMRLVEATSALVREKGLKFYWIPYFTAQGWARWQKAGFDAAILQPNYMFDTGIPFSRLEEAAVRANRYGMGIEIEADETVLSSTKGQERYLDYLRAGVKYGYMTEALHGYYQGVDILQRAFISSDPDVRRLYDATYAYVKGTFKPEDYPSLLGGQ